MSRRYPLDPIEPPGGGNPEADSWGLRLAAATAQLLLDIGDWKRRHADLSQALIGVTFLVLGLALGAGAAVTDSYLHRGVESGAQQPYVVHPLAKVLATNVDLRPYAANPSAVTGPLAEAGFQVVRQEFSWSEIEPLRGQTDWSRYDAIVEDVARRGITVIAVITDTPSWARSIGAGSYPNAPPRDPELLEAFTQTLTSRYGEAIGYIQLWDNPNLSSGWGGDAATGSDLAPYLAAFWRGARTGESTVRIVTPELAPVSDIAGGQGDLEFLDALYMAGSSSYFDVLGISLDGGVFSPDDRRVSATHDNVSRAILFRELMVRRGDSATPIWATSFGWAAGDSVSRDEQAEFVERGLARSWSEWPWMGLMVQWSFLASEGSASAPWAMVLLPEGVPEGMPTPLYRTLSSEEMRQNSRVANTGFMPMDFDGLQYSSGWRDQHLEGRTFRTTQQVGASVTFEFRGTGLIAYVRSGPQVGNFTIELDGEIVPGGGGDDGTQWDLSLFGETQDYPRTLVSNLGDTTHTITITLATEGELTLGGIEVTREAPFVWPIVLMTVASIIALFVGLRSIAALVAVRSGHLRRKSWVSAEPPLPQLRTFAPRRRVS